MLDASVSVSATATAGLTTAILLAGSATMVASVSANLTAAGAALPAKVILSVGTAGQVHHYDVGRFDESAGASVPVRLHVLTKSVAPAGIAGEALFTALYLKVRNLRAQNLSVTPIVNGVRQEAMVVQLPDRT